MVFLRIGAGFVSGALIAHNSHENVYMSIANCFVRPHWRYRKLQNEYLTKDHAVDLNLLDSYVKDVTSSFVLFWVCIGPIIYKTYFVKEEPRQDQIQDTFAVMLNNVNQTKNASDARKHNLKKEKGEVDENSTLEERKVSFSDYEAMMEKLEKDGKLDEIIKSNPKALHIETLKFQTTEDIRKHMKDKL